MKLNLFALGAGRAYGERIAAQVGIDLSEYEEREYEDGERKARPRSEVRGRNVFVIHALYGEPGRSVHDKLCHLLFFIGALKDAGANSATAIVPYLCYSRQDRKTTPVDAVTTRYVAQLFEAAGTDRVMAIDVHNSAAFDNAFRRPTEHLEANPLFARHFAAFLGEENVTVVSPDIGGAKRAERFRAALGRLVRRDVLATAILKRRIDHVLDGDASVGDVAGRVVIIVDDLIGTGSTLLRAVRACRKGGATRVFAAATHGLFFTGAEGVVADRALDGIVVMDTVPPFRLDADLARRKLVVLDSTPLVAEALRRDPSAGLNTARI
jgi:ribose-phosphate pyrophosphokinase